MKIAIYLGKNEETRSLYFVAKGIEVELSKLGHEAFIAKTIADCGKTDMVVNLLLQSVGEIEASRRFTGAGKQVVFFTANVAEFNKQELTAAFIWMEKLKFVAHSMFHYHDIMKCLDVFNPALRKKMIGNLHMIWGGIEDIGEPSGENDRDNWIVPYNRWNESQKACTAHAEVTRTARGLIALKGTTPPKSMFYMMDEANATKATEIAGDVYNAVPQPTERSDYFENLKQTGMFICTSNYESLGLMYLELLAAGAVGVFLRKQWIMELLPDYKLMADDKDQLAALAREVYMNYDKAQAYVVEQVRPFILQCRSNERFVGNLNELLLKEAGNE